MSNAPEPAGPAAETPPPTPEPVADRVPVPRIDAACEDLFDIAALQEFVGEGTNPLAQVHETTRAEPDRLAPRQLGSLDCVWTTAAGPAMPYADAGDERRVTVSVLPEGQAASQQYVDVYGTQGGPSPYGDGVLGPACRGVVPGVPHNPVCDLQGWIGGSWVELLIDDVVARPEDTDATLTERFGSVTDHLVAVLEASTSAPDRWQPSAPSRNAGRSCEELAPIGPIASATGVDDLDIHRWQDGPNVGQYFYALEQTRALRCSLAFAGSDAALGAVHVLPSGAWAFDELLGDWSAAGAEPIELADLPSASAVLRCADPLDVCRVDAKVDGDWMQVSISPPPPGLQADAYPGQAEFDAARASIEAVAALVAERMATTV
ncbi:hypothetical protein [Agromyces humi]|uniref:hypothetical protein n=1 Tax=Agromyces humi TaxID=1766800 RepID=UPI0013580A09|nr:hypothetical protein [Agromyces humi]